MISASDGFAVGDSGTIIRWNGMLWSAVSSPVSSRLNAVHCLSSSSCWAVGDQGKILEWNGSVWSQISSPTVIRLNCVEARSTLEAWACGDSGSILEYDGSWSSFTSPTTRHLYGITVQAPTDGWMVGKNGSILKDPAVYNSTGTFLSSILDTDSATSTFQVGFWNRTLPALTGVTVATRSGPTPTPDGSWSAFSSEMSVATGTAIVSPSNRYFQYRATLTTGDTSVTPSFDDITVTYR
jgi:photosystem II stability/assembly factor-like uncharacterized protein